MFFNYSMTIPQYLEYQRLKEKSPKFTEFDLVTAIVGSGLCFGKTLSQQLGYLEIANTCFLLSKSLFWFLIILSLIKGIEKTCNKKTQSAGVYQLIGTGVSIFFMLY